jgi:hypothetical protein
LNALIKRYTVPQLSAIEGNTKESGTSFHDVKICLGFKQPSLGSPLKRCPFNDSGENDYMLNSTQYDYITYNYLFGLSKKKIKRWIVHNPIPINNHKESNPIVFYIFNMQSFSPLSFPTQYTNTTL